MAGPGLAQDQTVEEILASIRQVINGNQSRPTTATPRPSAAPAVRSQPTTALPPMSGNVTAIHGAKLKAVEEPASKDAASGTMTPDSDADEVLAAASAAGHSPTHDVVELAIEQALDKVRPEDTRPETADPTAIEAPPPPPAAATPRPATAMPKVEPSRSIYEAPRAALQPQREPPRMAEPPRAAEPRPTMRPAAERFAPTANARSLLSPRANAAVAASFDDLARALASNGARTIDETVEDLLRPMLKGWLEDNLPSLVERLVREEIERVSRGGR